VTRVLVGKVGFDGHDRGVKVVTRILRDAGMEVIYAGLRQTPEAIAAIALQEDVDVIGLSMHNGAHLTLTPAVVSAVRSLGLTVPVVVGGIIPAVDIEQLQRAGAVAVLGPGAPSEEIVAVIQKAIASRDDSQRDGDVLQSSPTR
jgi:methylmalonyl-CoA mutase, C-terminal domain